MSQHPILVWLIALLSFFVGAATVVEILRGTQLILNSHTGQFFAYGIAAAHIAAGVFLLMKKPWSKYLFLVIALLELYSVFVLADQPSVVSTGLSDTGVPTTTHTSAIPLGNILWLFAAGYVWFYFSRKKGA